MSKNGLHICKSGDTTMTLCEQKAAMLAAVNYAEAILVGMDYGKFCRTCLHKYRDLSGPPKPWTSWRDTRDGTVITVIETKLWSQSSRFSWLRIAVDGQSKVVRLSRHEFEDNFELIYDPWSGGDV